MIGGTNSVSSQLTSVYASNSNALAEALTRLASGKKFQSAAEDLFGFVRANDLNINISGYDQVKENLTSFKAYTSSAVQAGGTVYENLTKMKDLAKQYINTTNADLKAEYKSDFDALKKQVSSTLDNTYVDGVKITATSADIKTVGLDPKNSHTLKLNFSANASSANVSGLDITDTANVLSDVQDEIDDSLTYLSEAKSFDGIVSQQLNLTDTIINSKKAVESLISNVDEASEMSKIIDLSVRQQATVSMMAQANIVQNSLSKLFET